MEPLSLESHKALLEIGDSTILGRALDSLTQVGVNTVTIVTGYRADDITEFATSRYPSIEFRFVHNDRYEITNNIVSLALALESLSYDEDVILIECDLLFEPHVLADLVERPGGNIALIDHYRTGMDGTVVATEDGYVSQVFPASSQDANFNYHNKFKTLNIYRFDRTFCQKTLRPMLTAYANNVDDNCYYEIVLGMLANIPQHRIAALLVAESDWVEVDDPNDSQLLGLRSIRQSDPVCSIALSEGTGLSGSLISRSRVMRISAGRDAGRSAPRPSGRNYGIRLYAENPGREAGFVPGLPSGFRAPAQRRLSSVPYSASHVPG